MDLTFKTGKGRFNYRVGAVIIKDGKLLMVKDDAEPYYYSVGGRVKMGETAEQAVVRETFEETSCLLEADRPIFIHENFFTHQTTGETFHELSIFFLMKPSPELDNARADTLNELGMAEHLEWLPLDRLSEYHIYPTFFAEELSRLPDSVKFIVTRG